MRKMKTEFSILLTALAFHYICIYRIFSVILYL